MYNAVWETVDNQRLIEKSPCIFCAQFVGGSYIIGNEDQIYAPLYGVVHKKCLEEKFVCTYCATIKERTKTEPKFWGATSYGNGNITEVCDTCYKKYSKQCEVCGVTNASNFGNYIVDRTTDDELWGCFGCISDCYSCGFYYLKTDLVDTPTGRICRTCNRRRNVIRAHDFNPMNILNFSGNPKDGLYFGVELEVESTMGEAIEHAEVVNRELSYFCCTKHDGSLLNGFEIVTCPASLEEQRVFWNKLFDLNLPLESFGSPRCGMHVHMSREAISPMHLARMMVFMYSVKNRNLIEQIAGRNLHSGWGERYAEINTTKKITDIAGVRPASAYVKNETGDGVKKVRKKIIFKKNNLFGRYTALNDTNDRTVEIRIFRGCNKRTTIFKNLEFCQALVDYCRPVENSLRQLENPERFAEFVNKRRHEYRYLHEFMKRHKLIGP